MQNIILFGAGKYGKAAARHFGIENVKFFVDNNSAKQGSSVCGIPVISMERLLDITKEDDYKIVICSKYYKEMQEQLENFGIKNYELYSACSDKRYYPTVELVLNPYDDTLEQELTEWEYNKQSIDNPLKKVIRAAVDELYDKVPLFNHIEIETLNRCNGVCSFCPINSTIDPREKKVMSQELFEKIIDELAELHYDGKIALFSNNEPFLDTRIVEWYKYCRSKLPDAWLHMFTNGTLLTLDKFIEIIPALDELVIDNYNQELHLIPNCKEIKAYCEEHEELQQKVTIVLRKPHEILSSRGGDAPNRKELASHADSTCVLPFKQMIVRPDGKVSLCCNDPLGKNTLGDLTKESLSEVWWGARFCQVRKALYVGRTEWPHCVYCDVFNAG